MYQVEKDGWIASRPWGCVWMGEGKPPLNLSGQSYKTKKAAQADADKVNSLYQL